MQAILAVRPSSTSGISPQNGQALARSSPRSAARSCVISLFGLSVIGGALVRGRGRKRSFCPGFTAMCSGVGASSGTVVIALGAFSLIACPASQEVRSLDATRAISSSAERQRVRFSPVG